MNYHLTPSNTGISAHSDPALQRFVKDYSGDRLAAGETREAYNRTFHRVVETLRSHGIEPSDRLVDDLIDAIRSNSGHITRSRPNG